MEPHPDDDFRRRQAGATRRDALVLLALTAAGLLVLSVAYAADCTGWWL